MNDDITVTEDTCFYCGSTIDLMWDTFGEVYICTYCHEQGLI